jgi:hypothetical protein
MTNIRNTQMDIEELKSEDLANIAAAKNGTFASGIAMGMMTDYIERMYVSASPADQAVMMKIIKQWCLPLKAAPLAGSFYRLDGNK